MPVQRSVFDQEHNVTQFTILSSSGDFAVKFLDYGAIITNILVKTCDGLVKDVVLGFDSLSGYKSPVNAYLGAAVGRVAGRIANATFHLNGETYQLAKNTGGRHHLHGGLIGFDQKIWKTKSITDNSVTVEYTSVDAEEHYPGEVTVSVTYTVIDDGELHITYTGKLAEGETKSTILNLTNHTYFNLSGADCDAASNILDHRMVFSEPRHQMIAGVLELNDDLLPKGNVIPLSSEAGAPYEFYQGEKGEIHTIGERIEQAGGYDIAFAFADQSYDKVRRDIVRVWSPQTNICLTMSTNEPAIQFYTSESLSDQMVSKAGQGRVKLGKRSAFCLEANRYANAINRPEWQGQVILKPGQEYKQTTIYKFTSYHQITRPDDK